MKELIDILLIGNGGREAAIAWKLAKSPRLGTLYCTSPHISPAIYCGNIDPADHQSIAAFITEKGIDMVLISQESVVCSGLTDYLHQNTDAAVIAPDKACSRLEASKEFAKEFMSRHAIPTARFMTVTIDTIDEGRCFLESQNPPYVLKADGLADGRGVLIVDDLEEAKIALENCINGKFGSASETVVIEEFLPGKELSVMVAVDGDKYLMLPTARDYKRLLDGDKGPNTAGMGSFSPSDIHDADFMRMVEKQILLPTLRGLKEEDMEYHGFLYLGVIDVFGQPMLLEYNVRLGDPETQAIIPRINSDFLELLEALASHSLDAYNADISPLFCVAIVLAEDGYPGYYDIGYPVEGTENVHHLLFSNGITSDAEGNRKTASGRVATVAALAPTLEQARAMAVADAETVSFNGKFFRKDIGLLQ